MAQTNNKAPEATSTLTAGVGIAGVIITGLYFLMANGTTGISTTRLVYVVLLLLANIGVVLVGFINKNSKDTFAIPYLLGMIAFVVTTYEYVNDFFIKSTSYMLKFVYAPYIGFGIYYVMCIVVLIVAYLGITGRIKNTAWCITLLGVFSGGFFFNFVSSLPQIAYRFLRASKLGSSGIAGKDAIAAAIKTLPEFMLFLGLIVLQIELNKKKED